MEVKLYEAKEQCTGCSACYNACAYDSIAMGYDEEGFRYPSIDRNTCTKCGACVKACPIYKENDTGNIDIPYFISAVSRDKEILKESSSGGVFSLLAKIVIENGGRVYGCAFNETLYPIHICIDTFDDIEKLRGSKYVQSEIGLIYSDVEDQLKQGRQVLFSGVSCQIAGLSHYLAKDYDNLLLVEILCHGVPSPLLFEKHINWLRKKHKSEIRNYSMRSKKKFGWGSENRTYYEIIKNGKVKGVHPYLTEYFTAFFYGISLRPSCYECKFNTPKRYGDVTLGDFWGYYKTFHRHFPEGISVVAINNEKGKVSIEKIANMMDTCEVGFEDATDTNIHFKHPMKKMEQRMTFIKI